MTLVSVLESLAVDTWERLRDARALEVNFGEETITDLLLLDLKRKSPPTSRIIQTSKSKEKDQGTDWEWWIGSDRRGWMRLAVQAKKLNIGLGRYTGFSHKVGSNLQIDLLERYAVANDAIPIYCLYNHPSGPVPPAAWQCCDSVLDAPQLACTITSSEIVRDAMAKWGKKTFLALHSHPETLPWRCLAKCPKFQSTHKAAPPSPNASTGAARLLGNNVRRFKRLPAEVESARQSGHLERFSPEFYNPNVGLYPRRVVVLEFSPQEDEALDG